MRTRRTQLRAYFKFCRAYNLLAFPVTEQVYWLYLAFLVGSFSSYNSVINYLTCLKQVNLYLGADVNFFASPEVNFLKQASKRVLAKSPARKSPITAGLKIAAGQRTMSGLIEALTGQTFDLPVMLTGQN